MHTKSKSNTAAYNLRSLKPISNSTSKTISPAAVRSKPIVNQALPENVTFVVPTAGRHSATTPESIVADAVVVPDGAVLSAAALVTDMVDGVAVPATDEHSASALALNAAKDVISDGITLSSHTLSNYSSTAVNNSKAAVAATQSTALDSITAVPISPAVIDADVSQAQRSNWTLVQNKKPFKAKNLVVGRNVSTELDVVVKTKWLHISSFKTSVTAEHIIDFVEKHFAIDKNYISCFGLLKKMSLLMMFKA